MAVNARTGMWSGAGGVGSARASRAAVDAPVHRTNARHRALFQIGCTDDARWRASVLTAWARSGTREARVLPVPVRFDASVLRYFS